MSEREREKERDNPTEKYGSTVFLDCYENFSLETVAKRTVF